MHHGYAMIDNLYEMMHHRTPKVTHTHLWCKIVKLYLTVAHTHFWYQSVKCKNIINASVHICALIIHNLLARTCTDAMIIKKKTVVISYKFTIIFGNRDIVLRMQFIITLLYHL